ncbi:MAG: hypothetical protein Q8N18_26150 [Opitutaceae bacterium]|nr:hypothetical protein [Opitutaceae bacterium]
MNPDPIDDLLSAYAKQPLPTAPDRLTADVWRDIERRRSRFGWLIGLSWHELLRQPRLAVAALGLALLAGLLPAATLRSVEHAQRARESLHFEVFSPDTTSVLQATARVIRK